MFPFDEYERQPLVSFDKSIESLVSIVPEIRQMVDSVKEKFSQSHCSLSFDESASIILYALKWKTSQTTFEYLLNQTLRKQDPQELIFWLPYLRLFIQALSKLSPISSSNIIYYGLSTDKSNDYGKDDRFVWWEFVSCKSTMDYLENNCQLIFIIECLHAKDISEYTSEKNTILLYPGKSYQVISKNQFNDQMKFIQLKEISQSNPPFDSPKINFDNYQQIYRLELKTFIQQYPKQSKIDLVDFKLTDRDIDQIIDQILNEKQCLQLFLSRNQLTSIGTKRIAQALDLNQTLECLSLSYNQIGDQGVKILTNILARNTSKLKTLSLHSTGITDESVKSLAAMLKTNTNLLWLHLGQNKITDTGLVLLTDVLTHENETLKVLALSENKSITDVSVDIILQLLTKNQKLETIWLTDCNISIDGKAKLREFISKLHNRFLLVLL